MSRTTDQWEALLEGTSSGNWVVRVGGVEVFAVTDHSRSFVADAGSHLLSCQGEALTEARKDAVLIAAAPEAVAEVIRLREALEERLRVWNKVAEKLEVAEHMSNAEVVRHTIHVVEHILNPEEEA